MSKEVAPIPKGKTVLEERYSVDVTKPLPHLSTRGGSAYIAVDAESPDKKIYALVQERTIPSRPDVYKKLKAKPAANMVAPIARGLMVLKLPADEQRMVTIFSRPMGTQLMSSDGTALKKLSPAYIRQHVVLDIVKALATLHTQGILHRGIHPTLLYTQKPNEDSVVLGECITAPAGAGNAMMMEPLELAFADTAGRGYGTEAADFFQFGVTLACLYFGEPLWRGKQRTNALIARVNQGARFVTFPQ